MGRELQINVAKLHSADHVLRLDGAAQRSSHQPRDGLRFSVDICCFVGDVTVGVCLEVAGGVLRVMRSLINSGRRRCVCDYSLCCCSCRMY